MTAPLALRGHVDGDPMYTLRIPAAGGWLNSNDRGVWAKSHRLIARWRHMAGWAAVAEGVKPMGRAYVLAEFRFADRRRRDPANFYPTAKACIDGLVDVGVLADDNADRLIGPDMRLGPVSRLGKGAVHLHLWELPDAG